jgi:hypothetical protein
MADQAYSTSRRALLTGICAVIPVAAIAAPATRETPVARAYAALLIAEQQPLTDGNSMHSEEFDFYKAVPKTFEDVRLKATVAYDRMGGPRYDYSHAAKLIRDLAVIA